MKNMKTFFYGIGVLFFLLNYSYGSQKVVVTSTKALIYADKELALPIGYVSFGKQIVVGEVARKGGSILPIIVSGKVAYIKVTDISSLKGKKESSLTRYYDADEDIIDYEMAKRIQKDLSKNNYINTAYGFFDPGSQWHTLATSTGSLAEEKINTIDLAIEHRDPTKKLSWGYGISLYTLTQESIKTLTLSSEIPFYYRIYNYKQFAFDLHLGLSISTGFMVKMSDYKGSYKGFQYGRNIGLRTRIPLTKNWGTFATFGHRSLSITSMDPIKRDEQSDYLINNISGIHFTFGANYKL